MSKYTKRANKHISRKRGGTRKRKDPINDRFMGCSAEYTLSASDKPRADKLAELTNQQIRDQISVLIGEPPGKSQFSSATTKPALIRLLICMENKRAIPKSPSELISKLTEINPTQVDKSAGISNILPNIPTSSSQPCGDGQPCPTGFRCNKTSRVCDELKK